MVCVDVKNFLNYLELELICITASRILKMMDYNGGALSGEEYIFQSRGMIIKLYALSGRYWPSGQNGRILAKIFIDRDEVEVNKNAKTNKASSRPSSRNNLGL